MAHQVEDQRKAADDEEELRPFPAELRWQNVGFGIAFLFAFAAAIALGAWGWKKEAEELQTWRERYESLNHYLPNATVTLFEQYREEFLANATSRYIALWSAYSLEIVQVFLWVGVATAVDALGWLILVRFCSTKVVWIGIVAGLVWSGIIAIANIATVASIPAGVVLLVLLVFKIIWYIFVRKEITFASTVVGASLQSVWQRPSLLVVSFIGLLAQLVVSLALIGAVLHWRSNNVQTHVVVFLVYWAFDGVRAITQVAQCGLVGHWYYFDPSHNERARRRWPALSAAGQALSKSFGAAALGSLILALIKGLKYFVEKSKKTKNPCVKCLCISCLVCCRHTFDAFSTYAYVFVAVFGDGFIQAGRKTMRLIKKWGLSAALGHCIVEDLQETGVFIGAIFALMLSLLLGFFAYNIPWQVVLPTAVLSLWIGFCIMAIPMALLDSTVSTLMILWAIDPAALKETKPSVHDPLDRAWQAVLEQKRKRKELLAKAKSKALACCKDNGEDEDAIPQSPAAAFQSPVASPPQPSGIVMQPVTAQSQPQPYAYQQH